MEVEVNFLSRRGTAVMRRAERVSGERVRIGRGTDNDVRLNDIHVGLHAAALLPQDGGLAVERLDNSTLEVNGHPVEATALKPGDELRLGPYRIEVLKPPEGCDAAVQVELVQAATSAGERLAATTRIGLERTGASKRLYAWSGFLVLLVICLAVPILVFRGGVTKTWHEGETTAPLPKIVGLSWNAGTISNAHRFFAADCATCHQGAFSSVADSACLACHVKVGSHVPHGVALAKVGDELAGLRCVDCHTEHRGISGSVIRTAGLCLDCHRGLAETAPAAKLQDVSGFPGGHPQFRATLVADAAKGEMERALLDGTPPPVDRPGLKFLHKEHMGTVGKAALERANRAVKGCDDCHKLEPSGQGFQPITYKGECARCHDLTFDSVSLPWQGAKVPHGDDAGVIAAVWNHYAGLVLQGLPASAPQPTAPPVERRGAGMPPPPSAAPSLPTEAKAWVAAKATAALRVVFDEKRGCAYCHYSTAAGGAWDSGKVIENALPPRENPPHVVATPLLLTRFLPNAVFDHASHRGVDCVGCHQVREGDASGEALMIPGKETCVRCHGTENAALSVQSTCITCHEFHHSSFGLMHMTAGTAQ